MPAATIGGSGSARCAVAPGQGGAGVGRRFEGEQGLTLFVGGPGGDDGVGAVVQHLGDDGDTLVHRLVVAVDRLGQADAAGPVQVESSVVGHRQDRVVRT